MTGITYKDSGVDRHVAETSKEQIKELARQSFTPNVLRGIGLFSGFYELDTGRYRRPVIVSSIDGIGTKVTVAQMSGDFRLLGHDLVNHCVNDVMVCGADPLFFLDYFAADRLEADMLTEVMRGLAEACTAAGCALIGGETAEMPGVYAPEHFDVAGAIVGVVEKDAIIDGSGIAAGDVLIGIASNGLHTNGYSLARKVLFEHRGYRCDQFFEELGCSLGQALLQPHLSYRELVRNVRDVPGLHGIAHITGGGLVANITRLLKDSLAPEVEWQSWPRPPIFELIRKAGDVHEEEMRKVFNNGIGLVLIVPEHNAEEFMRLSKMTGHQSYEIGTITKSRIQ